MSTKVEFYRHDLGAPELEAIAGVLKGPILTTGDTVAEFEQKFAAYLGRKHALGVTSCTGAMHMALLALGIGSGDEVITTPMTFIATAAAILEAGARPVFVDVEPDTGNIDAAKVEAAVTKRTKAILPVHLYGLLCDMRALRAIADKHGLAIIEDAAHCVEGIRDGVRPGGLAEVACFSFYATKNLSCGEGGAMVTDDSELYEKLKMLRLHGMTKNANDRHREGYQHWDMKILGWKYNMDNIQAAILLPQLERLDRKLVHRERLADRYTEQFGKLNWLQLPRLPEGTIHARHLFPVWLDAPLRDRMIKELHARGIGTVVNYRAIHLTSFLAEELGCKPGDFPVAESIGDRTISLPYYPTMPDAHVDLVCDALKSIAAEFRG
ncbi:MAG TPA: DegT/DnrJ/EryC1/StrS family aminotransferase [Reyranellaceae bacterium]|nr:DegT/DnrJ/EryC1/StrS family aminotransferase [Reyranellaceae bacterium]